MNKPQSRSEGDEKSTRQMGRHVIWTGEDELVVRQIRHTVITVCHCIKAAFVTQQKHRLSKLKHLTNLTRGWILSSMQLLFFKCHISLALFEQMHVTYCLPHLWFRQIMRKNGDVAIPIKLENTIMHNFIIIILQYVMLKVIITLNYHIGSLGLISVKLTEL